MQVNGVVRPCKSTLTDRQSQVNLKTNPRFVLLVDAIGATFTALATIFLLAGEMIRTGLPTEFLYAMGVCAACFACFDLAAIWLRLNPAVALGIIACANVSYCVVVEISLWVYRSSLTSLGLWYFCIEFLIVVTFAVWEWRIATRRDV